MASKSDKLRTGLLFDQIKSKNPWIVNRKEFVHLSPLPLTALDEECILGVDEAGRGPVLGPMVYAACYYTPSTLHNFGALGFADSKDLTEERRSELFQVINENSQSVGYAIHSLSSAYLSSCMLQKCKYNLNDIAHDTTIGLIRSVLAQGVKIKEIYIDTVGPPEKYEAKLTHLFPNTRIKVSKKADSLYPVVSAASICAKVTRDVILKNWVFEETKLNLSAIAGHYGSGYTSDKTTTNWLEANIDPVFGWPSLIRFSWSTCDRILEKSGVAVTWPEDEAAAKGTMNIKRSFQAMAAKSLSGDSAPKTTSRAPYFRKRSLNNVVGF